MKLKGEKELLAEEVYTACEIQLEYTVKAVYSYLGNLTSTVNAINDTIGTSDNMFLNYCKSKYDESSTELENSLHVIEAVNTARLMLNAIQSGDFTLEEIRGLHRAVNGNQYGFMQLVIIFMDSHMYNSSILAFIKLLKYFDIHNDSN